MFIQQHQPGTRDVNQSNNIQWYNYCFALTTHDFCKQLADFGMEVEQVLISPFFTYQKQNMPQELYFFIVNIRYIGLCIQIC